MVKGKFTLTGTDNNGFRHRYSIMKNEDFKKAFVKFMVDLGFDGKNIMGRFEYQDEETDELIVTKVKDIEDVCDNYDNHKYDVDVFYGKFKVIIIVRTKDRMPMVKHLKNEAKWIKPSIIKRIKEGKKIPVTVTSNKKRAMGR